MEIKVNRYNLNFTESPSKIHIYKTRSKGGGSLLKP